MKFHYLGTLSGTEPFANMHHSAWVLEVNGVYYWFEAGENCAHTAVTSGLDIMRTVALFVSHPHIDHVGGMANLLSCMAKMERMHGKTLVRDNTLQLFFPDDTILQAVKTIALNMKTTDFEFRLIENGLQDGLLFQDENVRVSALHNTHLKEGGSNGWHSYSFGIEAEGKRVVFSGDVSYPEEVDALVQNGCDLLIMETGHHDPEDVFRYAIAHGIPHLRLTHHGRKILGDRERYEKLAVEYSRAHAIDIRLCFDGMTEELFNV